MLIEILAVAVVALHPGAPQRSTDTIPLMVEQRYGEDSPAGAVGLSRLAALAVDSGGRLFVSDLQGPNNRAVVWVFGIDGKPAGQIGRQGSGPGEYVEPDNGLRVMHDGRLVVRDPPTRRMLFYRPDGSSDGFISFPPNRTNIPLFIERSGSLLTPYFTRSQQRADSGLFFLLRLPHTGRPQDTLKVPHVSATSIEVWGSSASAYHRVQVPFSPNPLWTWSNRGYFILNATDTNRIDLVANTGERRSIALTGAPPRVSALEREEARRLVTRRMQSGIPGWTWTGPDIPARKPYVRAIVAAEDGKIWVLRHVETARDSLDERVVVDVFDADGNKLWTAAGPPMRLQLWCTPVAIGNRIWVVAEDRSGQDVVVRMIAGGR